MTTTQRTLSLSEVQDLSGVDILRGMMEGRIGRAPFAATTRMRLIEVDPGRVVFEAEPQEDFLNTLGSIHGGWVATLLDSAMACAVHSMLKPGQSYTSLEMKVNFVRPVLPTMRRVRCEGVAIHVGNRAGTSEGRVTDAETGKLLAHGTETCMIFTPGRTTPPSA